MPVRISPMVLLLAVAASVANAQQPSAQTPTPAQSATPAQRAVSAVATIQTTARIVVLDVVAADKHGQPVKELKASDFVLDEDGVPQTLQGFTERDAAADQPAPAVAPTLPPNTFANYAPLVNSTAMTVLLFDTSQLSSIDAEQARQMVASYMKTVQPGAPMCIFDLDSRGLLLIQDFTTDPKALARAAESRQNAQWPATRFSARTVPVVHRAELAMLAHYLAGFPGRKNLIWFYGMAPTHIADRSKMLFPDTTSFLDDVQGLTATLTLSRVAVYPVDPRGVIFEWDANRAGADQTSVLRQAVDAQEVAKATGGNAFYDSNDIKRIVAEVQATGSHYYTLSYSPTNENWDGSFRKIQVRLANQQTPGSLATAKLRLEYRTGYYARETRPPRAEENPSANNSARRPISFSPKGDPALHNPANRSPLEQAMDFGGIAPLQILFQAQVTPDAGTAKISRKGERPSDNFLKEPWLHASYRNYRVHFSLDPRTLEFAQHTVWTYHDTIGLNTVVYDSNGVIVNSLVRTLAQGFDNEGEVEEAGQFWAALVRMEDRGGVFPMKRSFHSVANGRDGCAMAPFSKPKKRFPLMRSIWLPLTLSVLASVPTFAQTAGSSQPEGTISGTVLDEHGQPFKGVSVCTYMSSAPSRSKEARGSCSVTTDEAGQFRIDHMTMGTFGVEAIKPEDGYIAFAGTSAKEIATLTPDRPAAAVVLKLGPKPGILLLSVKDNLSGEPIISFLESWAITDSDDRPSTGHSGGQTITQETGRALVPPEKHLLLTISAPGYKKWVYHDPSDPSRPAFIRLQPGEERELLVELEPQAPEAH